MPATLKQLGVLEFWRTPDRQKSAAVVVSTVLHIGVIVVAGCLWLPQSRPVPPPPIDSQWNAAATELPPVDTLETIEAPLLKAPAVVGGALPSPDLLTADDPLMTVPRPGRTAAVLSEWFGDRYRTDDMALDVGAVASGNASSSKGAGSGIGTANGGPGVGGQFFAAPAPGQRFVYVIDCSLSMNHPHSSEAKTRFRRVKLELVKSIGSMSVNQQFFMIFFNDEAIPMPAIGLEPASVDARKRYLYWMQEIRAKGLSDPTDAFRMALELRPDVIHFLTDGDFTYKTEQELLKLVPGKTTIHTYAFAEQINDQLELGMELVKNDDLRKARDLLSKKDLRIAQSLVRAQELLETLAAKHGGKFHLIP